MADRRGRHGRSGLVADPASQLPRRSRRLHQPPTAGPLRSPAWPPCLAACRDLRRDRRRRWWPAVDLGRHAGGDPADRRRPGRAGAGRGACDAGPRVRRGRGSGCGRQQGSSGSPAGPRRARARSRTSIRLAMPRRTTWSAITATPCSWRTMAAPGTNRGSAPAAQAARGSSWILRPGRKDSNSRVTSRSRPGSACATTRSTDAAPRPRYPPSMPTDLLRIAPEVAAALAAGQAVVALEIDPHHPRPGVPRQRGCRPPLGSRRAGQRGRAGHRGRARWRRSWSASTMRSQDLAQAVKPTGRSPEPLGAAAAAGLGGYHGLGHDDRGAPRGHPRVRDRRHRRRPPGRGGQPGHLVRPRRARAHARDRHLRRPEVDPGRRADPGGPGDTRRAGGGLRHVRPARLLLARFGPQGAGAGRLGRGGRTG